MSLLTKTETTVNQLEQRNQTFTNQLKQIESQSNDIQAQYVAMKDVQQAADAYTTEVNDLQRHVDKFLLKANETDPDKQIYGAAAIKRIQAMADTFKQHYDSWSHIQTHVQSAFQRVKVLKDEQDKRILVEKAEQLRLEEAERNRIESERLAEEERRKHAAEQARLEAEQMAKEQEAKRLSELAAEQEKQRFETQERARLAEIAAREEQERIEKAKLDKLAADEAEAKRIAELRANRPPLERSKEDLLEAFDMLYESCVAADYTVVMQMLFKFVHQITANPLDAKLRTLNTNNSIIKQRLVAKKGGNEALQAIGFKKSSVNSEEISVEANADAWNQLTQAKSLIEKELEIVKSGRRVNKPSSDIQSSSNSSTSASPRPSSISSVTPQPSRTQPAAVNPFAAMFNNPASAASSNPFVPGNFDYSRFLEVIRTSQPNQHPTASVPPFPLPFSFSPSQGQLPLTNPFAMMQSMFQPRPPAPAASQANVSSSAVSSGTTAPSTTATVNESTRELSEEELLEQALAMSMDEPDDKTEPK